MMMFESVLILGALLIGAGWLSRGGTLGGLTGGRNETSIEVLERRFAEGSISVDEYQERRAMLIGRPSSRNETDGGSR